MAKAKQTQTSRAFIAKPKKNNKGIHSKKKTSQLKSSKNYKKLYVGQG
jgi:hypothetical protein